MKKYNPKQIESKWQRFWDSEKLYEAKDFGKPSFAKASDGHRRNFMLLAEFPYTSGNLHMGHWFTYSIADIFARYLRMNGKNVMYPIGFDAFGLPAENAAIKHGSTPYAWTKQNIRNMTKQLKSIGATFDWSRVVDTSNPEYYRWTQWIFLKLYEKGLAYRGETMVNWCPKDKTVLANEQVVTRSTSSGQAACCDRCDTPVEQRKMTQWMFKITSFADALIDDLKDLDWPEDTKAAQVNWTGRSEGVLIKFKVKSYKVHKVEEKELDKLEGLSTVSVFTTRPDTLFGATYLVLAPEYPTIANFKTSILNFKEVEDYIEKASHKTELMRKEEAGEKTGVELKGIKAVNPANNEEIPVWVADYVLGGYGTGAIMAVPAHDERDAEFARKFDLPFSDAPLVGKDEIVKKVGGEKQTQYRLRDWILSRQRYWGAPIPMVYCSKCGYQPVPEEDLPVKLPKLADFLPVEGGKSPLARAEKWVKVKCPKCGGPAERETDTMDTFVDSSWYFIRYTDPRNGNQVADKEQMDKWLPVPLYIGGREHNTMHLLYARFITKALNALGVVEFSEPFLSRRNHGVIMGPDGKRMSKSRGNVVDPDAEVAKYGADTVRMNFAFLGPFEQDYAWNFNNISGISRFLNRVWNFINKIEEPKEIDKEADKIINKYTKELGDDIKNMKFNTGVSGLMKLLNELEDKWHIRGTPLSTSSLNARSLTRKQYETFLKLLAPFAPHIAEELWMNVLGNKESIHLESWPEYDEALLSEDTARLVIQVNGRVRDTVEVKTGLSEEEAQKIAFERENVKKYVTGTIKKTIYIKDRVINLVV